MRVIDEAVRKFSGFAPHLKDDLRGEAQLAYIQAVRAGEEPGDAIEKRLKAVLTAERKARPTPDYRHAVSSVVAEWDEAEAAREPQDDVRKPLTPGQRKKLRRNIVIQAAWKNGCSQRLLAEVFGLPRSRIYTIVRTDLTEKARRLRANVRSGE